MKAIVIILLTAATGYAQTTSPVLTSAGRHSNQIHRIEQRPDSGPLKGTSILTEAELEREKQEIRGVIALETKAYYQQDYPTWRSTYVDAPYFREYGYWEGYPEKVRIYNGFAALDAFKKKQFEQNKTLWQGSDVKRTNENFRIYGEVAWYTSDEVSYDKKTGKLLGQSVETRILEKHNGQWKIAYLGFHYLPQTNP